MNELILPFKVDIQIGKTKNRYSPGSVTVKAKYKTGFAIGLCWLSFKIFFMGIKKFIE